MAVGLSIAIGMYYDLRGEVELAKELPPPQVTRVEYELKDELVRSAIMETQKQVEQIAQDLNRIEAYILQQGR